MSCVSSAGCWSRCTAAAPSARICSPSDRPQIVGIDARLAEIEELLSSHGNVIRCECGAPILRGSHFCPNCGRSLPGAGREPDVVSEETVIEPAPKR